MGLETAKGHIFRGQKVRLYKIERVQILLVYLIINLLILIFSIFLSCLRVHISFIQITIMF